MSEILHFIEKHGYWLVFVAVLARQACLPVPANLALLAAGALAGSRKLDLRAIVALSVLAFLFADLAWFEAGRKWGKKMLHFACGISGDPGACVRNANQSFTRYGLKSLLISKFVPGLDAVAAPLAGASSATRLRFLFFDVQGAILWSGVYAAVGYAFSEQLNLVAAYATKMGELLAVLVVAVVAFYAVYKTARLLRFVWEFKLARITPDELRAKLSADEKILILDVQRTGKDIEKLMTIPGALRIDPRDIEWDTGATSVVEKTPDREVIIYCTCPGEFTSARVALTLRLRGMRRVRPLAGGLLAWQERGYPVMPEVRAARSSVPVPR